MLFINRFCVFAFIPVLVSASTLSIGGKPIVDMDIGYSMLRYFLDDEQYLTGIRRVKTLLSFNSISDQAALLIDDIADASEDAIDKLDSMAKRHPAVRIVEPDENTIAIATLDELRYTTAKSFLDDSDNFEKNLLLSQVQVLPVISHLAAQLEQNETSMVRKRWLHTLSDAYRVFYQRAQAQLVTIVTRR